MNLDHIRKALRTDPYFRPLPVGVLQTLTDICQNPHYNDTRLMGLFSWHHSPDNPESYFVLTHAFWDHQFLQDIDHNLRLLGFEISHQDSKSTYYVVGKNDFRYQVSLIPAKRIT